MPTNVPMSYQDAIHVIRRLLEMAEQRQIPFEEPIVMVGGTGREKDQDDLFALYERTDVDALIDRFNVIWKWHGNRDAVLGYADRFVAALCQFADVPPLDVIARLTLPAYVLKLLYETWNNLSPGPSPKERGDAFPFGEGRGGVLE